MTTIVKVSKLVRGSPMMCVREVLSQRQRLLQGREPLGAEMADFFHHFFQFVASVADDCALFRRLAFAEDLCIKTNE